MTDYWQVTSSNGGQTWKESHIAGSFDMTTAPIAGGYFLGDYEGLSHQGGAFLPFFVQTNSGNRSNRTEVFAAVSGAEGDQGSGAQVHVNAQPQSWPERLRAHREQKAR